MSADEDTGDEQPSVVTPQAIQQRISQYVTRPLTSVGKSKIDEFVLNFIVKEMLPFTIVESEHFKSLIFALNPVYKLPTRKTFSGSLLNSKFDELSGLIRNKLSKTGSVSITTDAWTSRNNDSYFAVTCHFVDEETDSLKSVLLSCVLVKENHTADHIADHLNSVLRKWDIFHKVVAVVTDNAPNMLSAIEKLKKKHVPCFAHTLNLAVQKGIAEMDTLHTKAKDIVAYFKRSTSSANKLEETQRQMDLPVLKVKQSMPVRWNSSLHMFQRLVEVKQSLSSTIAVNHMDVPVLTAKEWKDIEQIINILSLFDGITVELSYEKKVTISKILFLIGEIKEHLNTTIQNREIDAGVKKVAIAILEKFNFRSSRIEKKTQSFAIAKRHFWTHASKNKHLMMSSHSTKPRKASQTKLVS